MEQWKALNELEAVGIPCNHTYILYMHYVLLETFNRDELFVAITWKIPGPGLKFRRVKSAP